MGVEVGLLCIGCVAEADIVPEVVAGHRTAAEVAGSAGCTVAVMVEEEENCTARCCYMSDEAVLEEAEVVEMQKPTVGADWSYHLYKDWMQDSSAG